MKKRNRAIIIILLLICVGLVVIQLSSGELSIKAGTPKLGIDEKLRIMVVVPDTSEIDLEGIRTEAEAAAEKCNAFLEFYLTATKEEQLQVLEIASDSHTDGILLYPAEKEGYTSALATCMRKEIPIVVMSRRVENAVYDSFIGSTAKSERMAALGCVGETGGNGKLLFIDRQMVGGLLYMEAILLEASENDASKVFRQMKTKVSDLAEAPFERYRVADAVVLIDDQASSGNLYTAVLNLLQDYQPDAVFSYAEEVTDVIVNCLTKEENLKGIHVIGYGNPEEYAEHLRDGIINGVVTQNDAYSASLGVRFLAQLRNGSYMPSSADSGITIISADTMERFFASAEK